MSAERTKMIAVYRLNYTPAFNNYSAKELWEVSLIKIGEAASHKDALSRYGVAAITGPING